MYSITEALKQENSRIHSGYIHTYEDSVCVLSWYCRILKQLLNLSILIEWTILMNVKYYNNFCILWA
jgi:hypothetical protein